jgi:hypothetical protein
MIFFLAFKKFDNMIMDAHLKKIKNVVDQFEEIGMPLLENIIAHFMF